MPRQCCEIRRVWTAGAAAALPSLPVHYCSCFAASPVECQCQCAGTHLLSAPCTAHRPHCTDPPIHLPQTRNRLLWCFPMLSITISHISIIPTNFKPPQAKCDLNSSPAFETLTDMLSDDNCLLLPDKPLILAGQSFKKNQTDCRQKDTKISFKSDHFTINLILMCFV